MRVTMISVTFYSTVPPVGRLQRSLLSMNMLTDATANERHLRQMTPLPLTYVINWPDNPPTVAASHSACG